MQPRRKSCQRDAARSRSLIQRHRSKKSDLIMAGSLSQLLVVVKALHTAAEWLIERAPPAEQRTQAANPSCI